MHRYPNHHGASGASLTTRLRALRSPSSIRLACVALMMVGCGPEETPGTEPGDTPAAASWLEELPVGEAATGLPSGEMRTIEVSAERVAMGSESFAANCVPCHAADGSGRLGTGPALNSATFLAAASDDYLVRTIARGREGTTMPSWARSLDREHVEGIVAFMRSWSEVEPAELDDAVAEGDAEAGGERFREICAACHGINGAGYQETSNGTGIGRSAFLADASNGYLRHIIRHGKSNTPMRPFGRPDPVAVANLTDADIENVIAHLRSSAW